MKGGTFFAFCCLFIMLFCCCTHGGVGVSGEIICNLVSEWLVMGGLMLSRACGAALMGGAVSATGMSGDVTLGKDGATLGDETGSCCDWKSIL